MKINFCNLLPLWRLLFLAALIPQVQATNYNKIEVVIADNNDSASSNDQIQLWFFKGR